MISQDKFSLFDPQVMDASALPNEPGTILVALRSTASLPVHRLISTTPTLIPFEYGSENLNVVYVGKSSKNMRTRIYGQHFTGTGGNSTLRKSLGCLLGLELIPRDVKSPENGETTFDESDESVLTEWMRENLVSLYYVGNDYEDVEKELIRTYNPPLNLQGNFNKTNLEYRKQLSALRSNNSLSPNQQSATNSFARPVRCRNCGRKLGKENLKTEAYYVCPKCGCSTQNPLYKPVKYNKQHSSFKSAFIILCSVVVFGIIINNCDSDLFEVPKEDRIDNTTNHTYLSKNAAMTGVRWYLKDHLKDPDSYQGIGWYFGVYDHSNNTFFAIHKYRAKNSFGGYVVEQKLFVLDSEGEVIEIVDE